MGQYTRRACGRLMAQAASRHVWSSTSVAALIVGDNWDLNLTGTYTVNANGTGTMTLPVEPSPPLRDRRWRKRA